ncbi:hypothetical protein [Thiothrix lacustris]|uniref:hypothetical protein n=1 Tax=Thiothrix lacustris TaxID=525917 RepID=UPI0027E4CAEC|nr:hypothetical protein [Thiothrix lacustris]WMP19428.1 hypothetical protein RCS87_19840 [Thiothrix lacustris]
MATGIERLHFMVGEWDIQAYNRGDNGEWVASPLPKETQIKSVFEGAFLQEDEVPMQVGEHKIRFFILWSYDKYRDTYRMLACDDNDGLADILEGNFEADTNTIVVSNRQTGTHMLDETGKPVYLRLTSTQNNPDSFTDEMHESVDNGASWFPIYRAEHTRKR